MDSGIITGQIDVNEIGVAAWLAAYGEQMEMFVAEIMLSPPAKQNAYPSDAYALTRNFVLAVKTG